MRMSTLSAALVTLAFAPAASAAGYQFTTFDHPSATSLTYILGVDNLGDIAGAYDAPDGTFRGYIRVNGMIQALTFPGSIQTICSNIEDNGRVTGTYVDAQGFQHGFQWLRGQYRSVDVPGAVQTVGVPFELGFGLGTSATRTAGDFIVGQYADASASSLGFVLHNGALTTIDFPGSAHVPGHGTEVFAANLQGVFAGSYVQFTSPPVHGFVYANGQYTTFDVPSAGGPFGTQINGINNQGTLVGPFSEESGLYHGFISKQGQLTVINVPGGFFTEVDGINDHDVIVGEWIGFDGVTHGYIGTP